MVTKTYFSTGIDACFHEAKPPCSKETWVNPSFLSVAAALTALATDPAKITGFSLNFEISSARVSRSSSGMLRDLGMRPVTNSSLGRTSSTNPLPAFMSRVVSSVVTSGKPPVLLFIAEYTKYEPLATKRIANSILLPINLENSN